MPTDVVEENNWSKQFVGSFARFFFQEDFKVMLYNVVIRGNDFDFIKWLGVHVECLCCGFFHFQIMEFF